MYSYTHTHAHTHTHTLTHTATPFFLDHPPATLITLLSYYVEFSCTVIGRTEPIVTWYQNGVEITGGRVTITDSTTEGVTGTTVVSTVMIDGAEVEDQGTYECEAMNDDGTNSTFTELTVRGKYEQRQTEMQQFSTHTLSHTHTHTHTLSLSLSHTHTLPPAPATITSLPEDVQADISQNATFFCEAFGSPLPQLLWARLGPDGQLQFLDNSQPEGGANESIISISLTNNFTAYSVASVLEIQNVQLSDQGTYLCLTSNGVVADNLTSVDNTSVELLVQGERCENIQ